MIPKNPLKLKRVYKTFVRKNFKILKELDKENKMFDNNGKFIELKGSSMNKPMKLNFMDFFCQNNALEVRYIILDNNNLEERFIRNKARTFNYLFFFRNDISNINLVFIDNKFIFFCYYSVI